MTISYGSVRTLLGFRAELFTQHIISESTFLGDHTLAVQKGLNLGVILFIVSEGLFFMAIF